MAFHDKPNYRTMMGCLIINGKRYPLYEGINTIGRCLTATVPLKSLDISKQHAIITIVSDNEHYVSDFQSFNGTFLKKSKLSPLLLYKLSQNSMIEFGTVTAVYNKISTNSKKHNGLSQFHSTQCASQSLYEETTQAVEDDISNQNVTVDLEQPQNYFDDDFSFDDISTQMINEADTSKSPIFKVPLSVRDVTTQRLCNVEELPAPENPTDVHDMETQKFEIEVPLSTLDVTAQTLSGDDNLLSAGAGNPTDIYDIQTQNIEIEVPLLTIDVTTQKLCDDGQLSNAEDFTNLHDMETQKFEIEVPLLNHNPTSADNPTNIHNMETQEFEVEACFSTYNVTTKKLDDVEELPNAKTDIHDIEAQNSEFEISLFDQDVTTKNPCENLPILDDPTDTEAQNIQTSLKVDVDNLNDTPTQVLTIEKEQENFDITSIIDETVLDSSQLDVAQVTIQAKVASQDSDSQSKLHLSQLYRRTINPIRDSEEENLNNSEIICNTESSEDEILFKSKKKMHLVESDTETDIEDLDENIKNNYINDSGSDTDVEGLEKSVKKHSPILTYAQKSPTLNPVNNNSALTDSDTDIDDFEFNTQTDNNKKNDYNKGFENFKTDKLNDDCNEEIIPGTQFADEDIFSESLASNNAHELDKTLDNTKLDGQMVNSVDMDSLYLEPTQSITGQSSNISIEPSEAFPQVVEDEKSNAITAEPVLVNSAPLQEIENENVVFVQPTQPVSENTDDVIFVKPARPISKVNSQAAVINANTIRTLNTQSEEEDIFVESTQPIIDSNSQVSEDNTNENVFMQPTQALECGIDEEKVNNVSSQPCESQDALYLQPTQPITTFNSLINTNTEIYVQATEALNPNTDEDVFMEPTQPLIVDNEKLFKQPTPLKKKSKEKEETDDIYLEATQKVNINEELVINDKVNKKSEEKEETDDIYLEATQKVNINEELVIIDKVNKKSEEKEETDDIYLEATQKVIINEKLVINNTQNIENKLENMFASEIITYPPVNNEIESQLEVQFESQNVSYRADISHRPLNPLLNEFKCRKNEELLNSEDPLLSDCVNEDSKVTKNTSAEMAVEAFIDNSSSNSSKLCENKKETTDIHNKEDTSKGVELRKSSLSLQKYKDNDSEGSIDDHHLKSSLPSELPTVPKIEENIKINKVTEKSAQVMKENNKKDQSNVLETIVINEDERKIETEEVIIQPTRTTRLRSNSKSANKKQDKKTTVKNPTVSGSKETSSKNKKGSDTKETSLLGRDVKTRPTRAAKAANISDLDADVSNKNNNSAIEGISYIEDKRTRTRSAKNKAAKESDSSAEVNINTISISNISDTNVTKRQKRAVKTVINVSEATTFCTTDSSAENSKDSVENVRSKTRSAKTKDTNTVHKSMEKHTSDLNVLDNNTTEKPQPTATSNINDDSATNKKGKTRALKGKKLHKNDLVLKDEAVSSTSNQKQTSKDDVEVSDSNTTESTKTLKTNKRKSIEDNIKESDSSTEINESVTKRARRVNFENSEACTSTLKPTRTTRKKQIFDIVVDTPQKKRRGTDVEIVNVQTEMSTPDRNRRKQKPKVVFTMLDSPELESVTRSLGGTVVNSVENCTVLVTGNLQRTQKLLSAVGQGKPICSPKWLQESKKASQFLDPWDHILEDKQAESNWKLSLKESLTKSQSQKLFENYTVYITVTNSVDVLKAAIESCGGKCVTKAPRKITNESFVVVANRENKSKYSKFLNQDPPINIVVPEAIFDGVLRQELRFEEHLLS